MKLSDIFNLGVKMAEKADPRGKDEIKNILKRRKKDFDDIPKKEKEFFDKEKLKHLYDDSRIITKKKDREIKKILVGIDMEVSEILLAKAIDKKIDLIHAHHPEDISLRNLSSVMNLQTSILEMGGVPQNVSEKILSERIGDVDHALHSMNTSRVGCAAEMLGFSFMNTHTITDNLVFDFLTKLFKKEKPRTLGDMIEILGEIDEYKEAKKINQGPKIFIGDKKSLAGKILCAGMTGGTEGAKEIYSRLSIAGTGTVVDMHMSKEHSKKAKKHFINVIIAGHMASDSLGMNLYLDEIEKKGVEIIPCSGLIRVKRF